MACENVLPHLSHLKGFCPMWARTWLFSVVAPTNVREQKPHLNGRSALCDATCVRSSEELLNVLLHCPHWKGLVGGEEHACICRATRWVKVLWHCWHFHEVNSLTVLWGACTKLLKELLELRSESVAEAEDHFSEILLSTDARLCWREYVGTNGGRSWGLVGEFFESEMKDSFFSSAQ